MNTFIKSEILIIDAITTSYDPDSDVVDIALCRFNLKTQQLVSVWSSAIQYTKQNSLYFHNGISRNLAPEMTREKVREKVLEFATGIDSVLAYGAPFISKHVPELSDRKWTCAMHDLAWNRSGKASKSLALTALDNGVAVSRVHRAIDRLLTLVSILEHHHNLHELFRIAPPEADTRAQTAPNDGRVYVSANVTKEERQIAKDAGFVWSQDDLCWWKMFKSETEFLQANFQFTIDRMASPPKNFYVKKR